VEAQASGIHGAAYATKVLVLHRTHGRRGHLKDVVAVSIQDIELFAQGKSAQANFEIGNLGLLVSPVEERWLLSAVLGARGTNRLRVILIAESPGHHEVEQPESTTTRTSLWPK
jgi:hypothetical protein